MSPPSEISPAEDADAAPRVEPQPLHCPRRRVGGVTRAVTDLAAVGEKVLAGLAKGRRTWNEERRAAATELRRLVIEYAREDQAKRNQARGRPRRISKRLTGYFTRHDGTSGDGIRTIQKILRETRFSDSRSAVLNAVSSTTEG